MFGKPKRSFLRQYPRAETTSQGPEEREKKLILWIRPTCDHMVMHAEAIAGRADLRKTILEQEEETG